MLPKNTIIAGQTVMLLTLMACNSDNRELTVREYLAARINGQSGGAMRVDGFRKTNGYKLQQAGLDMYVVEWQLDVSAQQDFWKAGNALVGFWEDFTALSSPSSDLAFMGARRFRKGAVIQLSGDATLLKTERGWRVQESQVKSSEILDPGPKSPFEGVWRDATTFSRITTYITVREDDNGTFRFGQSDLGPITNDNDFEGRLRLVEGSLRGTFDRLGPHGMIVKQTVVLTLGSNGKLSYSVSGEASCDCTRTATRSQ